MEFLERWFTDQPDLVGYFQVVLDVVLIFVVIGTIHFCRRQRNVPGVEELSNSLQKIIEETGAIARDFDANLKERQALIQNLLAKLDQRVMDAQKLCGQLDAHAREPRSQASGGVQTQGTPPPSSDHRKVMLLAQKGLSAEAIAKRLQKPLGEVELILNLQRLSSTR